MNKFVVNGKEYNAKPVDFNMVCDMEDMGFSLEEMEKGTKAIRAYFALCANIGLGQAGKEIEKHFIENKEMPDIHTAFLKELEQSDFFQALIAAAKEKIAEKK